MFGSGRTVAQATRLKALNIGMILGPVGQCRSQQSLAMFTTLQPVEYFGPAPGSIPEKKSVRELRRLTQGLELGASV